MFDAGVYTCRVSAFSGSVSGHTLVKVGSKPRFTSNEDEVYSLEDAGWTQILSCDADAVPPAKVLYINIYMIIYFICSYIGNVNYK